MSGRFPFRRDKLDTRRRIPRFVLVRITWYKQNNVCFKCGGQYSRQHRFRCPARRAVCRGCSIAGHYQRVCWRKQAVRSPQMCVGSKRASQARMPNQTYRVEQCCQTDHEAVQPPLSEADQQNKQRSTSVQTDFLKQQIIEHKSIYVQTTKAQMCNKLSQTEFTGHNVAAVGTEITPKADISVGTEVTSIADAAVETDAPENKDSEDVAELQKRLQIMEGASKAAQQEMLYWLNKHEVLKAEKTLLEQTVDKMTEAVQTMEKKVNAMNSNHFNSSQRGRGNRNRRR